MHDYKTARHSATAECRFFIVEKSLVMGNDRYTLIDIDNDDAVITAAEAVKDVKPEWKPDRYNTFYGC